MFENLSKGEYIRETHKRFRNIIDYEAYIFSIDHYYDSEDAIFNGYSFTIDTPLFSMVNRSKCGNRCDLKHEVVQYNENNCLIS